MCCAVRPGTSVESNGAVCFMLCAVRPGTTVNKTVIKKRDYVELHVGDVVKYEENVI